MMIRKKDIHEGAILSIKVKDNLFTLAQIRSHCRLDCFKISNNKDEWEGVDLNITPLLFCIVVADHRLCRLFNTIQTAVVKINQRPMTRDVIHSAGRPHPALVRMGDTYESWCGEVLIHHLTIEDHLEIIYRTENTSMQGFPEDIRGRLLLYFETGVNWDKSKEFRFTGIKPPPPYFE